MVPILRANIARETALMTDEAQFYKAVGKEFASHEAVNHGVKEYGYGILPFDGEPQWLDQPGEHLVAKTGWKIETSG